MRSKASHWTDILLCNWNFQLPGPVASAALLSLHEMLFYSSNADLRPKSALLHANPSSVHVCSFRHSIPCLHAGLRIACLTPARGWVTTTATLLAIWSAGRVSLPITRIYCAVSLLSALRMFLLHVVMVGAGRAS